jgi:prepilin-type N-terminal cleavage/methylation domain-containing protein
MSFKARKSGFTWIELIIVIVVIAVALAIAVPFIQSAREKARRTTCINNLKQIGLALHNYHDLHKRFPGSADLIGSGPIKQAGGWSFLVHLLPMMGQDKLFKTLPIETVDDPLNSTDKNVVAARNTLISELICPSNPNKHYQDPWKKLNAFTNYKGMGATSAESLICCADPNAAPPYGNNTATISHPDGALFPGKGLRIADLMDGSYSTIMAVETIDDINSIWIAGSDMTLVGMPKVSMSAPLSPHNSWPFWIPTGFTGKYFEDASPEIKSLRTYLSYDFCPGCKDAGSYPASVGRKPNYGPSSGHPNIVNHLFASGDVQTFYKDVDYAMYFFLITRNNSDPGSHDL